MGSAWFDPVADSRKCPDLPLFEGVVFGRLLGLAVGRVSMFEGFFLGDILTLRGEMVIFFVFFGFAVLFPELDLEDLEEVMDHVDLAGEGGTKCDDFPVGKQNKDNVKRSKARSATSICYLGLQLTVQTCKNRLMACKTKHYPSDLSICRRQLKKNVKDFGKIR